MKLNRKEIEDGILVTKIISVSDERVIYSPFYDSIFKSHSGRFYLKDSFSKVTQRITISQLVNNYAAYPSLEKLTYKGSKL